MWLLGFHPRMGYGAASACPQLLSMTVSCSRRGVVFLSNSFLGTLERVQIQNPRGSVAAAVHLLLAHLEAMFAITGLIDSLTVKIELAPRNSTPLINRK